MSPHVAVGGRNLCSTPVAYVSRTKPGRRRAAYVVEQPRWPAPRRLAPPALRQPQRGRGARQDDGGLRPRRGTRLPRAGGLAVRAKFATGALVRRIALR
jgi:hypothetical protein